MTGAFAHDMKPWDILAALDAAGIEQLPDEAVYALLKGSERGEQWVARTLNRAPVELWPSRYYPTGRRKPKKLRPAAPDRFVQDPGAPLWWRFLIAKTYPKAASHMCAGTSHARGGHG